MVRSLILVILLGLQFSLAQANYTVQAGDSLSKIAQRFNLSVADLLAINQLPDPDLIDIGQILIIPSLAKWSDPLPRSRVLYLTCDLGLKTLIWDVWRHPTKRNAASDRSLQTSNRAHHTECPGRAPSGPSSHCNITFKTAESAPIPRKGWKPTGRNPASHDAQGSVHDSPVRR